jgi:hypothetical protein
MGICASFSITARASTAVKLALLLRSLNAAHALPPAGTVTPAVVPPEPLMPVTKYTPPVARAVNALLSVQP